MRVPLFLPEHKGARVELTDFGRIAHDIEEIGLDEGLLGERWQERQSRTHAATVAFNTAFATRIGQEPLFMAMWRTDDFWDTASLIFEQYYRMLNWKLSMGEALAAHYPDDSHKLHERIDYYMSAPTQDALTRLGELKVQSDHAPQGIRHPSPDEVRRMLTMITQVTQDVAAQFQNLPGPQQLDEATLRETLHIEVPSEERRQDYLKRLLEPPAARPGTSWVGGNR